MPADRPQPDPLPRLAGAYWHDLLSAMGARRITSTVLLLLGTAALDAASLAGLLQLMRVLGGHGLAVPASWAATLNPNALTWALALFVGLAWLRGVASRHSERSMVSLRMDHVNRLRQRLEAALAGSPWARLSQLSHTAAQHLLFQQMQRVQQGTHQLMQLLSGVGVALATLGVAAWVAPWWTALLTGLALALLWAARASLGKAAAMGAQMGLGQQALLDRTREFLSGLKQVKAAGEEPQYLQAFSQRSEQLKATQLAFIDHQALTRARFEVAGLLVFAGLLWALSSWSRLPWPELLLLVLAFARVWPAARNAQQQLQQLAHALPAFAEIEQAITASTNTNATSANPRQAADTARPIEATPLPLETSLGLQGVHAGAGPDDTLQGVTLQLQAHQLIALTGPSGAGKTTLADVLVGLLAPRAGQVVLDGQPLTPDGPMLPRWQRAVAYVTQEPFLMAGTVRSNLCWPGPAQPDAALWAALARSDARGFVEALPGGLDHPLGEHGSGLSGGERQRLALARALLRRPSLLVLDEATSQLDAASEARVLSGLRELLPTTTIVAIAHRPAVLHQADRVITLDHGRVASDTPAMTVVTAHPMSNPRTTTRTTPRLAPRVVWFTGLSGAGKSTIAEQVVARLRAQGQPVQLLDGDLLRHGLNSDLGFSLADRTENIRRVAEVARVLVDAGVVTLAALISPLTQQREMARRIVGDDDFLEVHVDTALAVAEQRDVKGLYAKARRGELRDFTGIDSPYEAPLAADLRIDTARLSPEQAAEQVLSLLATARFAAPTARAAP